MADIYAAKVKAAIDKLKPKSLAIDIVVVSRTSVFDPDTQSAVISETTQKAVAIISSQTITAPDGIRIVERVFKVPGASLKVAPVAGDLIRYKDQEYTVLRVETKMPSGIPLLYEVVVAGLMADHFVLDLQKFAGKSEAVINQVIRKVALDILTRVVMRTPVANPDIWKANDGLKRGDPGYVGGDHIGGRARGGWSVGINVVPDSDPNRIDEQGNPTISAGEAAILRATLHDTIFLCNATEYIVSLEEGSSTQAPAGMLTVTLKEFGGIVKSAAANPGNK